MNARSTTGTVYLVGAGPGDPGLITVRGQRLLRRADVVVHDRLVARELLGEARTGAEIIDAGKSPGQHRFSQEWINAMIVDRAMRGLDVVRLKGGDPFVFGRGFEEVTACGEAGVPCVVIPGVSSAMAAPAAAGIPVTTRGLVRSLAIVTAQVARDGSGPALDFAALAAMDTIVILMGRAKLGETCRALIAAGRSRETPAACIERATTADQRSVRGTLESLEEIVSRANLQAPVVTVIGQVAAVANNSECKDLERFISTTIAIPRAG